MPPTVQDNHHIVQFLMTGFARQIQTEVARLEQTFSQGPLLTNDQVTATLLENTHDAERRFLRRSVNRLRSFPQFSAFLDKKELTPENVRHNYSLSIQLRLIREFGNTIPTVELAETLIKVGLPVLEIGAGSGLVGKKMMDHAPDHFTNFATHYYALDIGAQTFNRHYGKINRIDGLYALDRSQEELPPRGIQHLAVLMCYPYVHAGRIFGPLPPDGCLAFQVLQLMDKGNIYVQVERHKDLPGQISATGNPWLDQYIAQNFEKLGEDMPLYQWPHGERPVLRMWRKQTPGVAPTG